METRDDQVMAAINALERRAERQESELSLYNTYVDGGVLAEFSDTESQVLYGRRGVGKTHLLSYHRHRTSLSFPRSRYFIFDCQKLGSGTASLTNDPNVLARNYAFEFFSDLATQLFDSVYAMELSPTELARANDAVMAFNDHIRRPDGSFDLRNLSGTLSAILGHANIERLYVGLDEFIAIPMDAQPYFAQYLRKVFSQERRVILKIAAVTYQTALSSHKDNQQIGLEIGADIFSDIDLDSYFLLDENPVAVAEFFSQVLYNHVAERLGWSMAESSKEKQRKVVSFFFTQEKSLQELIRASEGNCRDLLNVFRLAYSEFRRSTASRIGIEHVNAAARAWFRGAKLENLSPHTKDEAFLNHIIQSVIKEKRSRHFMVSYQYARHPLIIRLLNLRLFHRMKTTWSHPDRPGEPYHIFVIDYGCYVDLKGTRSEPNQQVFWSTEKVASEYAQDSEVVPLPDRRSIRRIVITKEELDAFYVPQ